MAKNTASSSKSEPQKFVGLDVHKETIAIAVADRGATAPRSLGVIRNDLDELRKTLRRLASPAHLRVCYEAGACGYVVYRFLERLKIDCLVIAPSLIPRKPGDRIKTDRRDALALARLLRSGDLTATWVPDREHEALRDLVRAREDAVEDRLRARHRLSKFLLRLGITAPAGVRAWSARYRQWLGSLRFDDAAQQLVFTEYRYNLEELDCRIVRFEKELEPLAQRSPHAQNHRRLAGHARDQAHHRGDDHQRDWRHRPFSDTAAADGLCRIDSIRTQQRRARPARRHNQMRQRASASCSR